MTRSALLLAKLLLFVLGPDLSSAQQKGRVAVSSARLSPQTSAAKINKISRYFQVLRSQVEKKRERSYLP